MRNFWIKIILITLSVFFVAEQALLGQQAWSQTGTVQDTDNRSSDWQPPLLNDYQSYRPESAAAAVDPPPVPQPPFPQPLRDRVPPRDLRAEKPQTAESSYRPIQPVDKNPDQTAPTTPLTIRGQSNQAVTVAPSEQEEAAPDSEPNSQSTNNDQNTDAPAEDITVAAAEFDQTLPKNKESWLPLKRDQQTKTAKSPANSSMSFVTMFSSLAVVIGIFLGVAWLMKRGMPKQMRSLPADVVERLGTTSLGKEQIHLVRLGNKLLLITAGGTSGPNTLAEISDPAEVDRLAGICEQNSPGSVSDTFREILSQVGREPITPGFLGNDRGSDPRDEFQPSSGERRRA